MGEGQGGGENAAISASGIPLPLAPSHQGRGNYMCKLFYLSKVDIQIYFLFGFCTRGALKLPKYRSRHWSHIV